MKRKVKKKENLDRPKKNCDWNHFLEIDKILEVNNINKTNKDIKVSCKRRNK